MDMEQVELLIVGAGILGLGMASTYLQIHPDADLLIVDNASTLGGTWATERLYNGLKTNNIVGSYEFSNFPMDPAKYGVAPESHIPGSVVHQYLTDVASHYDLHRRLRLATNVVSAKLQDDDHWLVKLARRKDSVEIGSQYLRARRMVIATGLCSQPKIPTFPDQEHFSGPIFHAKELRSRHDEFARPDRIAVVGCNKSAWDACYEAASRGTRVSMLIRPSGGGPSYIWPKKMKWWGFEVSLAKIVSIRALSFLDPSPFGRRKTRSRLRDLLHQTRLGRKFVQMFWDSLDRHVRRLHGYDKDPETAKLAPWSTPYWMGTALSVHNYEKSWFDLVRAGMIKVHIGNIASFDKDMILLSNGDKISAEAVVCCTGWRYEPSFEIAPFEATGLAENLSSSPAVAVAKDTIESLQYIQAKVPSIIDMPKRTTNAPPIGRHAETGTHEKVYQLYRNMIPWQPELLEKRSIAYIGNAPAVQTILIGELQALWIAAYFDDRIPQLRSDVVDWDKIRRNTILESIYMQLRRPRESGAAGGTHSEYVFDGLNFLDTMMTDLGLKVRRKSWWWQEWFQPYGAKEYKTVLLEWMHRCKA